MANHGTIGPFEQGKEDWTSYSERLEQYFAVNDSRMPENSVQYCLFRVVRQHIK